MDDTRGNYLDAERLSKRNHPKQEQVIYRPKKNNNQKIDQKSKK